MSDEIFIRLKKIMDKIIPSKEEIKFEHSLKEDLNYDSLELINLYFEIEREFKFEMANEDLSGYELETVKQLVDYIETKTPR
ncbi:MAG: phosphopantetheine-binding protein [Desulfobacula sp.]|jgi:acyl carrier protein